MAHGECRADKTPASQHERRHNAPIVNEMAIVIVRKKFESRDIVLHRRNGSVSDSPKLIAHMTHCNIQFCSGKEKIDIILASN